MKSLLVAAQHPDAEVTRYRHWEADAEASVAYEATRLANQSPQLVIAKSLGAVIAATAFCLHEFRPAIAVLIGTPYAALESNEVQFLRRFAANVDTMFIQQAQDPGGSAALLATALQVSTRRGC
jgi:alpha-beta hydrolase superfamily lysophospholipase